MTSEGQAAAGIAAVVITDLVDSTRVRTRLGDRAADEIRREHDRALSEAATAHGGRVVKGLGDGLMMVFATASEALEAAIAVQQAVHSLNNLGKLAAPLGVRVGVSAGDVTWEGSDCFGTPVVEADRLCKTAEGGEIRCADAVKWLARGRAGLKFRDIGQLDLKGLGAPVMAVCVQWSPVETGPIPLPPWTASASDITYVGRGPERDRIFDLWKDTADGGRHFVVVSGEPGIGKTRLSVEVAKLAAEAGGLVLGGRCDEDLAAPFQPFAEALRHFTDHGGDLRGRLGSLPGDLVRIVPDLATRVPNLPAPKSSDPDSERWRLFDAVASWFSAMSAERPVLLLLDDLHWASKPTLQLLGHVLKSNETARLLVLATYRDTELRRTHPLSEALADLRLRVGVERVALRGLDVQEIIDLLEHTAGHDIGDVGRQLAHAVWTETEGNPFFVGEVMRNLIESGRLYFEDERWVLDGPVSKLGIPEGVREVIGRRLTRLTAATNEALSVAAVIGTVFDRKLVETAGEVDGEALDDVLDEAVEAGVLEELEGRPGHYRFSHTLVRSTLYEELRTARRVRLHARVAEAIEKTFERRLDDHLADLAHHYSAASAAGFGDRAVAYAMRAAERSAALGAHDEVIRFCEVGADAAELRGDDHAMCDFLILAGTAQWRSGQPLRARETFERAAKLARELDDPERLAHTALGAGGGSVRAWWVEFGRLDRTLIGLLEEALNALPDEDSSLRALVMAMLARDLMWEPTSLERRRSIADESVAMARRLGNKAVLGRALYAWVTASLQCGATAEERDAAVGEIIAIATELEDAELEVQGRWAEAMVAIELLQRDRLEAAIVRTGELADVLRQPFYRWLHASLLATSALLSGRLEEAEQLARDALAIGQVADEAAAYEANGAQLLFTVLWRDEWSRNAGWVGSMSSRYPTYSAASVWPAVAAMDHSDDEARRALDGLVGSKISRDMGYLLALEQASMVAGAVAEEAAARWLLKLWDQHNGQVGHTGPLGWIALERHHSGVLHLVLGEHQEAVGCLETALAQAERIGAPAYAALARAELGRALRLRGAPGDAASADELLRQADEVADRLGLGRVTRRVREVRSDPSQGERYGTETRPIRPGLRARAERLVTSRVSGFVGGWARGKSDAEIERRFGSARVQRGILTSMARTIKPDNAGDLNGDVVLELARVSGTAAFPEPDIWTLELREGEGKARTGPSETPLLTVRIGIPDFVRLLGGEFGAWEAVVSRRMRIEGDLLVALRFEGLFAGLGIEAAAELSE